MNTAVTTSKQTSHLRTSHHRRVSRVLYDQGELLLAQVARLLGITPGESSMLMKRARSAFAQHDRKQEVVSA